MSEILKINDLNYKKNNKLILNNINLSLNNGQIVGLLGENGAGKTTLMRLIAGVNSKTNGKITVSGVESKEAIKSCVSMTYSLSSFDSMFINGKGWLTSSYKIKNVVKFYLEVYPDFDLEKYQGMAKYLNIDPEQKITALSTGGKEKLVIALTLARQVPLYLLDEPLNGIDIMTRKKIIKSIIQWKPDDSTIIISSHYMSEIASLLDEIVIIKDQTIKQVISVEEIQTKYHQGVEAYYEHIYEGGNRDE